MWTDLIVEEVRSEREAHAERLGFRHPRTGEFLKFRAPIPPDIAALLELLELLDGNAKA